MNNNSKSHVIKSRNKGKQDTELAIANKELALEVAFQNKEKAKLAAELVIANMSLAFESEQKENRADELIVANIELVFQNAEKEKRAAELSLAKKELAFQSREKGNRASELVVANIELVFQNAEKEKRTIELFIANEQLVYQNREKEKQAAELIAANKELAFQNNEKGKLAAELVVANQELAFQNLEKEKRAAELVIANKELVFQSKEKEKRAVELTLAVKELKRAENNIRKMNEELEQTVVNRTSQLLAANKELESFSYSVSHDLRAPLRAVNGFTRILKEDFTDQLDEEAQRIMSIIMANAKKMGQLIDDLLEFSRLGRKEMIHMNIKVHEMVSNLCVEIKDEYSHSDIKFNVANLLPVKGDGMAIKQVWTNLISNAVKYSSLKETTEIEIGCEEKENEIMYYIRDNGAGFDMRFAQKLFGVFQRLHSEEEFTGTGVGLAIVHRIITKHGGTVWAESKVNEGATFYFTLNKS